jgi:hypothetical protein
MSSLVPKKREARASRNNNKKSKPIRYYVHPDDPFYSPDQKFTAVIRGRPLAWQRVGFGWNGTRYNRRKREQQDFPDALKKAFSLHNNTILNFGEAELEASIRFAFKPPVKSRAITSPPDLDNPLKFVVDALQGTFYTNDS